MKLGYQTITWGGVTGDATGVTSVKDLFYRVNGSMEQAVADIAAAGYDGVEMFDGNLVDYIGREDDLRRVLDEEGVVLASVYTGANFVYDEILADELHRIRRAVDVAATFGAQNLVVGGGARRASGTPDSDYDRLGAALDQVTDIAAEQGLTACYHPHLTTIVESPAELARMLPVTRMSFCPDTGHLAAGGGDPAALIRSYPDRVRHVHLKDFRADPFGFVPLGRGDLDFIDILSAVKEIGYEGWVVVELDSYDGDPAEAARISKRHLDSILTADV